MFRILRIICPIIALLTGILSSIADQQSSSGRAGFIGNTPINKVLFLGNSITLHGPLESIGWSGNWGMAASEENKDFVHLLTQHITETTHKQPKVMVRNIADFERGYQDFNIQKNLESAIAFEADLIIIAIGENVTALKTEEDRQAYETAVRTLLKELHANNRKSKIFVRSVFWSDAFKDEAMSQACASTGATFVDLGKLDADETHFAISERQIEHAGVARHPGDKGMRVIADGLWKAIKQQLLD